MVGILGGCHNNPPNNPPNELDGKKKICPLCVYNPNYYQELPELFIDYVYCMTSKSPSTTGAGLEGALSKGPFNAMGAMANLKNMMVDMILMQYGMTPKEHNPKYIIVKGFLEKLDDFEYQGCKIPASHLGYCITKFCVHEY